MPIYYAPPNESNLPRLSLHTTLTPELGPTVTNNSDSLTFKPRYGFLHVYITAVLLSCLILCTVIGNVFVVAAIILDKNLQSVSNHLILSLAVADLMVATLVMPIGAVYEVSDNWWLGVRVCDLWVCFDVLCCTASILHLVAIAVDRYWAVTRINYIRQRTARRIIFMIVMIWFLSVVVSIPSRFYYERFVNNDDEIFKDGDCMIQKGSIYTVFSTVMAFYLPMFFIICIYVKIYQTARARIRKKAFNLRKPNLLRRVSTKKKTRNDSASYVPSSGHNTVDERLEQNSEQMKIENISPSLRRPLDLTKAIRTSSLTHSRTDIDHSKDEINSCNEENEKSKEPEDNEKLLPEDQDEKEKEEQFLEGYHDDIEFYRRENRRARSLKVPAFRHHSYSSIMNNNVANHVNSQQQKTKSRSVRFKKMHLNSCKEQSIRLDSKEEQDSHCNNTSTSTQLEENQSPNLINDSNETSEDANPEHSPRPRVSRAPQPLPEKLIRQGTFEHTSAVRLVESHRDRLEHKRERKAARTLAIITGCFILCWLPFFLNASIMPFLDHGEAANLKPTNLQRLMESTWLWLGYFNSLLNPIIYTIFAPDFRNAFHKILFGRYRRRSNKF